MQNFVIMLQPLSHHSVSLHPSHKGDVKKRLNTSGVLGLGSQQNSIHTEKEARVRENPAKFMPSSW